MDGRRHSIILREGGFSRRFGRAIFPGIISRNKTDTQKLSKFSSIPVLSSIPLFIFSIWLFPSVLGHVFGGMSGQESVLPTYQSVPDSALESLIEKETKQEYGASAAVADDGNGIFNKKNKVKAGTVFVLALVIAIFTLRAGFFGKKAQEYNTVGVSPEGFPANSVQGVIANNDVNPIGTIISEQQEEVTTDVDASYIEVIQVPSEPAAPVVESSEEVVEEEEEAAVEQQQEEAAAEEAAEEETSEVIEPTDEVAVVEPVYEPPVLPDPTAYPVAPPTTAPSNGRAQPTNPTGAPTAAMQINAAQLKRMRSDSRLSPLSMSMYTDANNWIKTFFSKYGLVGTRFTNKQVHY